MKRFFTFLMAVWALLSISQTVMATDYFVRGAFGDGDWPAVNSGLKMTPKGGNTYVLEYVSTQDGEYRFRFTGTNFEKEMCPYVTKTDLSTFSSTNPYGISTNCYEHPNTENGRYFIVNMKKGTTYVFTFIEGSSRQVWCDVNTSTTPSEFTKLSLIGGLTGKWGDIREFSTTDGKIYQYVFDTDYTNTNISGESGDYYFRVKTESKQYAPYTNDDPVGTEYTDAKESSEGAWKLTMTKGKSYTLIFDYENKKIRYVEGGSSVVTKVIKLFNGSSEVTGSNGKYTLDLSGETSTDATITLDIDGTTYGLATAQTIAAAGTTSGITFTAEGAKALTLKAGLIYSLSVTEDGKMTVVAEEKVDPYAVYGAGFYLVGDFMSPLNDKSVTPGGDESGKINYERLYFKFEQQNDGSYKIDIPACLTAKMQILGVSVDGVPRVFGPSTKVDLYGSKDTGTANPKTNGSLGGKADDLLKVVDDTTVDNYYWNLKTRNDGGIDDDGLYEISFKYDSENKTPTVWTIEHDALTRVAYLLSDAEGATAQPVYVTRKKIGSELRDDNLYSNECKAALHFNGQNGYYVLSYIVSDMNSNEQKTQALKAKDGIHATKSVNDNSGTHDKLFFLGNGGYDWNTSNGHNKVRANLKPFTLNLKGTKVITYNPNQGDYELAKEDGSYGMTGEIKIDNSGVVDYPDAISMVGPAIPSTTTNVDGTTKWLWAATAGDMTYDESDRCYKLVLNTSADSFKKTFRFVGDHDIAMNWYEDTTPANDKYPDETKVEGTSDATVEDPNYVDYTSECTEEKIHHEQDIIWNRGAGLWTVRFYIDVDNDNKRTFRYTIRGASKIFIPVTAHMGKLLRTYTSAIDVVPVDANVLIYAAQSYQKNADKTPVAGGETGTVKLYRLKFIPANQGVVLYSPNSPLIDGAQTKLEVVPAYSETVKRYSSDVFDYVKDWAKSETPKEQIWVNQKTHVQDHETWNNYLMPVLTDTKVTQFYYENNEWSGRNFFFTRYSQTKTGRANKVKSDDIINEDLSKRDYFSFFRGSGTVKASYSYLMLPKNIMTGNGQILDENHDTANKDDINNFSKSMAWFEGVDAPMDNETTGISELKNNTSNTDAAYYTLQGMKVVKPVKGIYIHQGKKVIVK